MNASRIRLTKPVIASRADAEKALGEIAATTAERNGLTAQLDAELTAVRQRYEGRIEELAKAIEARSGLLQSWAESAPEEFEGRKSLDLLHGRLGFRTSTPAIKLLSGWPIKRVIETIAETFIRVKKELDRELLLAAYQRGEITDADLRKTGCRVVQEESFFVEPKLEEVVS